MHGSSWHAEPPTRLSFSQEKFNKELDPSLAFRTSSKTAMVQGVGGFINPDAMQAAERPREMGVIMKNGRMQRLNRPRATGEPAFWETSTERAVNYHHRPETVTFDN
jgi:hypothetical protein